MRNDFLDPHKHCWSGPSVDTLCKPTWTRHWGDIKASEVSVPQTSISQACGVLGGSGPLPSPLGTCFFKGSRRPSF